jgi:hypothetical protein
MILQNHFLLAIKFSNDSVFKVDEEKESFRFGELFKNKYGVFRLNKNSYTSRERNIQFRGNRPHRSLLVLPRPFKLHRWRERIS